MRNPVRYFDLVFAALLGFIIGTLSMGSFIILVKGGNVAGFNECENLHEVEITPDRLREIASEMERRSRTEYYQAGQVIRYKINHRFALVFRPEKAYGQRAENVDEVAENIIEESTVE
jgi:hypothetical protein